MKSFSQKPKKINFLGFFIKKIKVDLFLKKNLRNPLHSVFDIIQAKIFTWKTEGRSLNMKSTRKAHLWIA
ncbi:hypothetical protein COJ96_18450 [Bacillus sp. AFS073361]|nr:hypothetical protein COJ96_18450 [Bacillus sp. AFS073361]